MRKEIFEQPRAIADALLGRHDADGRLQLDEVRISDDELREVDKIIIIACGTAFYAGLVAKYAIEHWTRIPCEVELAHEFRYRDPILTRSTLVVAISQSGETADTLMAIRHARAAALEGAGDLQHQRLDDPARVRRGHLHPRRARDRGRLDQGLHHPGDRLLPARALPRPGARARRTATRSPRVVAELGEMPGHVQRMLDGADELYDAGRASSPDAKSVLFLGRHVGYPVALEGALKLKELAYIHAEGFAAGELKHGPIALIEDGLPVFCVVPPQGRDQLHDKMVSAIQEIRARGARTIVLAEEDDPDVARVRRHADPAAAGLDAAAAAGRPSYRCSCSPASWPRCSATTSTSRATWPSPSRSSRPASWRSSASASTWCDIARFADVAASYAGARASGCSPPGEVDRPPASLAARFAAKEALAKALGAPAGMAWHDAEVVSDAVGPPAVRDLAAPSPPAPPSSAPPTSTSRSPTTPASPRPVVVECWTSARGRAAVECLGPCGAYAR